MRVSALLFLALFGVTLVRADPSLDEGYRAMYNLHFDQAHRNFSAYQSAHPDDPLAKVSDAAAYLFAEFDRLHILQSEFFVNDRAFDRLPRPAPDLKTKQDFESALNESQQLAETCLKRNPADSNALLANTLRLGLHADYLALIEKREFAALAEVKRATEQAQALLSHCPDCYDAYLAQGVENYLLSLKPAPLRWFLRAGGAQADKQLGLEKLRLTAEKGRYLKPYARLLLAVAALRDDDRKQAASLLAWLSSEFPGNPLYRQELAKVR